MTCPFDCNGTCACGDGVCNPACGETVFNCQSDCLALCVCGNSFCEQFCGENGITCPTDCGGTTTSVSSSISGVAASAVTSVGTGFPVPFNDGGGAAGPN